MISNILEDNKSISDLLQYVNSKIVELRQNKGLDEDVIKEISKVYSDTVDLWMVNNYIHDVEPSPRWENEIQDKLSQLISYLNSL
jgi:hypothetical protein